MVEVKRKDGESPESLLRRFSRRVQQSGVLIRAKKGRYHSKKVNKLSTRKTAARRKVAQDKHEHLRKIGKLETEPRRKRGRRRP